MVGHRLKWYRRWYQKWYEKWYQKWYEKWYGKWARRTWTQTAWHSHALRPLLCGRHGGAWDETGIDGPIVVIPNDINSCMNAGEIDQTIETF